MSVEMSMPTQMESVTVNSWALRDAVGRGLCQYSFVPNLTHLSDQNKSWDPVGCFPAVFGRSMAIIMRPLIRSRRPVPHGTVQQSGLQACIIVECSKFQKTHSESLGRLLSFVGTLIVWKISHFAFSNK